MAYSDQFILPVGQIKIKDPIIVKSSFTIYKKIQVINLIIRITINQLQHLAGEGMVYVSLPNINNAAIAVGIL